MGSEESKLAAETGVPMKDFERLRMHYDYLTTDGPRGSTGHRVPLTLPQFQSKFPVAQQSMAALIFCAMDSDGSGEIDFREFSLAFTLLSKGTEEAKIDFAFALYDSEKKGYIRAEDVSKIVNCFSHSSVRILRALEVDCPELQSDEVAAEHILRFMQSESGDALLGSGADVLKDTAAEDGKEASHDRSADYAVSSGAADAAPLLPADASTSSSAATGADAPSGSLQSRWRHASAPAPLGDGKVTRDMFARFCRSSPEAFKQAETAFQALRKAALMEWDRQGAGIANAPGPSFLTSDTCVVQ